MRLQGQTYLIYQSNLKQISSICLSTFYAYSLIKQTHKIDWHGKAYDGQLHSKMEFAYKLSYKAYVKWVMPSLQLPLR